MKIVFEIPIKVISEMNWRGHWAAQHVRKKEQKGLTYAHCLKEIGYPKTRTGRYEITLTRLMGYRERKFDGDNLQGAFKAVRDGIADYLGIDDGSERLSWRYRQEKASAPGIVIEIEEIT